MFDRVVLLSLTLLAIRVSAQQVGTNTAETHPPLTFQHCTGSTCTTQSASVVLDSNWRWVHNVGGYTNCYTGNTWNPTYCPDDVTCAQNCALEGADYSGTYGITTSGNALRLNFVTSGANKNIGSRVYLMAPGSTTTYQEFNFLNQEFAFDVDVSHLPCGLNGALYLSEMDADGGMSKYPGNKAGAKYGTGYCDSQCPHDIKFINGEANSDGWQTSPNDVNAGTGTYGTCCNELDIWEANSISTAYTPHPCTVDGQYRCSGDECGDGDNRDGGVCDKDGCDFNSFRMGVTDFYGPGLTVDTTQKFTVITQFLTDTGTASGNLNEIRRIYVQNGVIIANTHVNIPGIDPSFDSVTEAFCQQQKTAFGDTNSFDDHGGFGPMTKAFQHGMVLVLSLWDDHAVNMLWLDSDYPTDVDPSTPGVARGTCPTTSGAPTDVETNAPNSYVIYSNIKYGDIGYTWGTGPVTRTTTTSTSTTSSTPQTTSTSTSTTTSSTSTSTTTSTKSSTTKKPKTTSTTTTTSSTKTKKPKTTSTTTTSTKSKKTKTTSTVISTSTSTTISTPTSTSTSTTTTSTSTSTTSSTTSPAPAPPPSDCSFGTPFQFFGVSESGAEFGQNNIPGVLNTDYTWPSPSSIDYFVGQGFNTFRIPFLMERLSPPSNGLTGDFDSTYLSGLQSIVSYVTSQGAYAAIDPHNYARYNGDIITDYDGFQQWWQNLASIFADDDHVIFDLNNEPNGISASDAESLMQAGINGVRASGASNIIFVEGTSWTGAWTWVSSGNGDAFININDPLGNTILEMHQYLDSDGSGTSDVCVSTTVGVDRLTAATEWLQANGLKAILGEIGAGSNDDCIAAVYEALCYMQQSGVWVGALWWAAGPWWGTYFQSIEPPNGAAIPYILPEALLPFVAGLTGPLTTTTETTTTTSEDDNTPTTTTPDGPGQTLWGQCGGMYYTGPTWCAQGTCQFSNPWYSQCLN